MEACEFLTACKKELKEMLQSKYSAVNPFIGKYHNTIAKMIVIYQNPANQNIKDNLEILRQELDAESAQNQYNLDEIAKKVINYSVFNNDEAKALCDKYFHPCQISIKYNLNQTKMNKLENCFFLSSINAIDRIFNTGTFGCVLSDALDKNYRDFGIKQEMVKEELSRLLNELRNIYYNSNAAIMQNAI